MTSILRKKKKNYVVYWCWSKTSSNSHYVIAQSYVFFLVVLFKSWFMPFFIGLPPTKKKSWIHPAIIDWSVASIHFLVHCLCRCSVMKRATEPKTLQHWTTWPRHLNGPWWAMNREGSIQRKLGGIARRRRTLVAVKHFRWTNLCVLTFAVGLVRSMRFERVTYFKYEVEERFRFHFWSAWLFGNMMATFSRSKLEDYINVACNWTFKPKKTIWRNVLS